MDNNLPALKKTCMNCGLQKPLAAFLQLGGPEGTTYGAICGDCRKAAMKSRAEHEGETTRRSTDSIKPEHRLHAEITKKENKQRKDAEYKEDREKHEKLEINKDQKIKVTIAKEKQLREEKLRKQVAVDPEKTADKQKAIENKERVEQNQKSDAIKVDEQLKNIDLSNMPFIPSGHGALIKFNSDIFRSFRKWVGESAAINKNLHAGNQPGIKPDQKNDKTALRSFINTWPSATEKNTPDENIAIKPNSKPTRHR